MRMMAVAVACLVLLGACSSKATPSSTSQARPLSTATLSILQPTTGSTIDGKDVEVKLSLVGGTVTMITSRNIKPNVGHIHLRLDGTTITILGSLDDHIKNVNPGQHIVQAEYVASDHLPFARDILATVSFMTK